jgi:hypothetical protein
LLLWLAWFFSMISFGQTNPAVPATAGGQIQENPAPGKTSGAAANKMEGPLRQEAYSKITSGFFPCQDQLELPPGDYVLRLGVRDNSTGLIGSATAQVSVPRTEEPQKPETKNP